MDHAINSLRPFMEVEIDFVREEWETGKYKKLSECPSYPAAKAIIYAIHKMEKYCYGEHKTMSVKEQVMMWY